MEQDFDWDVLLFQLRDRKIVPVIGKELLMMPDPSGEGEISVERWVVGQLLEAFAGETAENDEFHSEMSLNEFTLAYMSPHLPQQREIRKRMVQQQVANLLLDDKVDIPDALKKLAEIECFDLFISTTPDTLIDQAIAEIRGTCESRSYRLKSEPQDIQLDSSETATYHVFGKFDDNQDFAITDEDMVEFLYRLSSVSDLRKLKDFLGDKSLLLIGCGLPKTLVPYLARTMANDRLFPSTGYRIVDRSFSEDPEIIRFWKGISGEALISNDPVQFIDELHERWTASGGGVAGGAESEAKPTAQNDAFSDSAADDKPHVFISYRRDDAEAADKIVDALRSRNITVWYDQDNIQGGDDWRREIAINIEECLLFMPILSSHSEAAENVSIEEWGLALERRKKVNKNLPFYIPVVIEEGIGPDSELIYEDFWVPDVKTCLGGEVSEQFLDNVQSQIRKHIRARR